MVRVHDSNQTQESKDPRSKDPRRASRRLLDGVVEATIVILMGIVSYPLTFTLTDSGKVCQLNTDSWLRMS